MAVPSSTTPSQSLSSPSHTSGEYVHWHTSPVCPFSAAQVHPATQSATVVHVVEHTLPVQPASPPSGSPTGWQIPLGQPEFAVHGWPVSFVGAFWHVPPRQVREPVQVEPEQQVAPTTLQLGPASVPESSPEPELLPPPASPLLPVPELLPEPPLLEPPLPGPPLDEEPPSTEAD